MRRRFGRGQTLAYRAVRNFRRSVLYVLESVYGKKEEALCKGMKKRRGISEWKRLLCVTVCIGLGKHTPCVSEVFFAKCFFELMHVDMLVCVCVCV